MTTTDLLIIIPVFNGWEQTERCLRSIEGSSSEGVTVVVVDHGSTDGTKTELPRLFPDVVHLMESEELWWTGATNVGIRHALETGAGRVMLLNNDCEVEADTLARLAEHAGKAPDAVIAPVQRSIQTGEIMSAGATPCLALGFPTLVVDRKTPPSKTGLIDVQLIMGGRGVVIPRSVFDRIGLLDEHALPHYLSDHDFYFRCRDADISLKIAVDATVLVDEARTSMAAELSTMKWSEFLEGFRSPRSHRNVHSLTAFFRKHYPIRSLWWVGVALNLARYGAFWLGARAVTGLRRPGS